MRTKKETNIFQEKRKENRKYIFNFSDQENFEKYFPKKYKTNGHFNPYKIKKYNKILSYLNLILLIQILLKKYNSSYIELTISGSGTKKFFYNKINEKNFLIEVDINNIIQVNVIYEYAFVEQENIVKLYYHNLNNMKQMFYSCSDIKKIDLSNFDSSTVTTMKYAFYGCSSLEQINLSNMNAEKATDISHMFEN